MSDGGRQDMTFAHWIDNAAIAGDFCQDEAGTVAEVPWAEWDTGGRVTDILMA